MSISEEVLNPEENPKNMEPVKEQVVVIESAKEEPKEPNFVQLARDLEGKSARRYYKKSYTGSLPYEEFEGKLLAAGWKPLKEKPSKKRSQEKGVIKEGLELAEEMKKETPLEPKAEPEPKKPGFEKYLPIVIGGIVLFGILWVIFSKKPNANKGVSANAVKERRNQQAGGYSTIDNLR